MNRIFWARFSRMLVNLRLCNPSSNFSYLLKPLLLMSLNRVYRASQSTDIVRVGLPTAVSDHRVSTLTPLFPPISIISTSSPTIFRLIQWNLFRWMLIQRIHDIVPPARGKWMVFTDWFKHVLIRATFSSSLQERFYSVALTESSLWTEAYNTAYDGTPGRDISTPPPSSYYRRRIADQEYEEMSAIKEEDYEEDLDFSESIAFNLHGIKLTCYEIWMWTSH